MALMVGASRFSTRLTRNSSLSVLQTVVATLSLLITYRIVATSLGITHIGIWSLLLAMTSVIRVFDPTGSATVGRFVAIALNNGDPQKAVNLIDTATSLLICFYSALAIIAWWPLSHLAAQQVPAASHAEAQILLPWILVSLIASVAAIASADALDGLQRADVRALIMMSGFLIMLVAATLLVKGHGLLGLAYAQLLQYIWVVVAARLFLRRTLSGLGWLPMRFSPKLVSELLGYGSKMQLASIANYITEPLVRILLNQVSGITSVGLYEIASKLVVQVRQLVISAMLPLVPVFAVTDGLGDPGTKALTAKVQRILLFAAPAMALVTLCASPLASLFLTGRIEKDLIFYTAVLAWGYGVNTMSALVYIHAQAVGRFKWNLIGQFSIGVTTLIVGLALAPYFGDMGVVGAFGLGLAFSSVIIICFNLGRTYLAKGELISIPYLQASLAALTAIAIAACSAAEILV